MFSAIVRPSTTSSSWYIVAMPSSMRRLGRGDLDRLAEPRDLALVGAMDAREHLDQRRLARAVLAEDAVHLAGQNVQVDSAQRVDAGEGLRHASDVE